MAQSGRERGASPDEWVISELRGVAIGPPRENPEQGKKEEDWTIGLDQAQVYEYKIGRSPR
jgi:hypothetical protein